MPCDLQFKIRAWDELNNVMHYDFEYLKVGDTGQVVVQSDIVPLDFSKWPPEYEFQFGKLIRMIYTMVKDVNGKEIYYQDLVKVINGDNVFVGAITYNSGGCPYAFDVNTEEGETDYSYAYLDNKDATFEVIGNVHENPELCPKIKYNNA